ncbi:hypothetical protein PH5382_02840 [Phaeobacter sp. CECT 5382]|uniref:hypothetical protein n=1 Tax=Phaeobacter sp. CECT 5382 TaxID=1712645 RepID=UPI0006DB97FA|nr:hypothetical protein [Phaeobacter sp. CECT 5382]CUH88896.1 hypothetical protein PH5382_02840 [Phaeobacter sp. CECT 5382]
MAHTVSQHPVAHDVLSFLAKPFVAFGNLLVAIGEANHRDQTLRGLMAQSDAELARRGLKRDELVHHVFSDSYYL